MLCQLILTEFNIADDSQIDLVTTLQPGRFHESPLSPAFAATAQVRRTNSMKNPASTRRSVTELNHQTQVELMLRSRLVRKNNKAGLAPGLAE
jgi:hypothetical protein